MMRALETFSPFAEAEQVRTPDRRAEQDLGLRELAALVAVLVETLEFEAHAILVTIVGMLDPASHRERHAVDKERVHDIADLAHLSDGTHLGHWLRTLRSGHDRCQNRSAS